MRQSLLARFSFSGADFEGDIFPPTKNDCPHYVATERIRCILALAVKQ